MQSKTEGSDQATGNLGQCNAEPAADGDAEVNPWKWAKDKMRKKKDDLDYTPLRED